MDKQFYNIAYTGLDKDRVDMQHYIREQGHKSDSIYLDTDSLSKSNRNLDIDFEAAGGKLTPNEFAHIEL